MTWKINILMKHKTFKRLGVSYVISSNQAINISRSKFEHCQHCAQICKFEKEKKKLTF